MRHRATPFLAALACALAVDAGAGTKLLKSWRDPAAAAAPIRFQKVLVFCTAPHESQRQFAEARLVQLMKRTRGVASYTVVPAGDLKDRDKVRALMARDGYDGAVVLRFIGTDQQVFEKAAGYVPLHTSFYGSYAESFSVGYDPGYVIMDRQVQMETQVYSMKDGQLVWSGVTQTKNPKSAQTLVDDVARTVAGALRKQRVIE